VKPGVILLLRDNVPYNRQTSVPYIYVIGQTHLKK
jgi:hypothetical protein